MKRKACTCEGPKLLDMGQSVLQATSIRLSPHSLSHPPLPLLHLIIIITITWRFGPSDHPVQRVVRVPGEAPGHHTGHLVGHHLAPYHAGHPCQHSQVLLRRATPTLRQLDHEEHQGGDDCHQRRNHGIWNTRELEKVAPVRISVEWCWGIPSEKFHPLNISTTYFGFCTLPGIDASEEMGLKSDYPWIEMLQRKKVKVENCTLEEINLLGLVKLVHREKRCHRMQLKGGWHQFLLH